MSFKDRKNGFTLIEIIVVIGIIALLASGVLASATQARKQGRNAKRKSDLKHLQLAITTFYDAGNAYGVKSFPSTGGVWYSSASGDGASNNGGDWIPGLSPTFIDSLPKDPGGNSRCASPWKAAYNYKSDGRSYKLIAHCSPEGTLSATDPLYDPVRPTDSWMVCAGTTACSTW